MGRHVRFFPAHAEQPSASAERDTPHGVAPAQRRLRGAIPVGCWVFILAATGAVQIVRAQWFDAAVFLVAAAAVALGAAGMLPRTHVVDRMGLAPLAAATAIIGATLCFLPRHSVLMKVVVIAAGLAAVALAWPGAAVAHPDAPTGFTAGVRSLTLAWAIILILGCLWELAQFILGLVQPSAAWFSLSDLLNPAIAAVPGRIAFIAVWLAGGVWLVRRGGAR